MVSLVVWLKVVVFRSSILSHSCSCRVALWGRCCLLASLKRGQNCRTCSAYCSPVRHRQSSVCASISSTCALLFPFPTVVLSDIGSLLCVTLLNSQGCDFRTLLNSQGCDFRTLLNSQGRDFRTLLNSQGFDFRTLLNSQGCDFGTLLNCHRSSRHNKMQTWNVALSIAIKGRQTL